MNDRSASDLIANLAFPGRFAAVESSAATRVCEICGHHEFGLVGMRGDGLTILRCVRCGMGVADRPDGKHSEGPSSAAEVISVGSVEVVDASGSITSSPDDNDVSQWVGAIAALLVPSGEIANLSRLPCCLDAAPGTSPQQLSAAVLVATRIYEKAPSFSLAISRSVDLLREDGVLLFEVPVIVPDGSNAAWLSGDFDNRHYPTPQALHQLVERRLGCSLTGITLFSPAAGPTFVGAICKLDTRATAARQLFAALEKGPDGLDDQQTVAWLHLHLLHARHATAEAIAQLPLLLKPTPSPRVMERLADVWLSSLTREEQWRRFNGEVLHRYTERELEIARLEAELETVRQDARLNTAQAALAIVHEMERGSMAAAKAASSEAKALQAHAEMERRYHDKDRELQALRASHSWRITQPLRSWAHRYPRIARRIRQAAKLAVWTMKLTVVQRVGEVLRQRAMNREANQLTAEMQVTQLPEVKLLPVAGFFPDKQDPWHYDIWPTGRPLISIIIPCFNYGHLVSEAIRSVEEQTLPDIEIIVVEGGSDSIESRRGFKSLAEHAPQRVRVLLQEKPHRAGANRNFGISHARGKYICCLDADDRLAPTYLEKALFQLEHYSYDVVSPALQFFGDRHEVWAPPVEQPTLNALLEGNQVLTCAVFRRSFWERAGGFRDSDPTTGHLHEDWLFWTRLAALGARFHNMREPLLFYRSHGQTLSTSAGVLEIAAQKHYLAKFNADVIRAPGRQMPPASDVYGPVVNPLRNLVRLRERFQHAPSLLLAVPYLVLGGAERLLSSVVAHLVERGWHITIVSTVAPDESQGDTTPWFNLPGVSIYHLPRFLWPERWKDFTDYLFATRNFEFLWVVGSAFFYDYLPALKGSYPQLRVVDLLFNSVGHTRNNRRYARYIDMNLVENRDVWNWLLAAGEQEERIETISSGVDLEKYSPGAKNPELLHHHGISPDSLIIGFSGRWSEEKDPLAVIEIAARIPAEIPVVFAMTGAGPMAGQIADRIANTELPVGRVVVCGAVPDMAVYLRSYDVLLLPSRIDGRPNVVMEALACGVPVVASRVGALPELVDDGIQGYLCEPGAYDQFASRIVELAADRALLAKFKKAARAHAEQKFDVRDMQVAYARVFDRLMERDST